jgi:hypothetical protein
MHSALGHQSISAYHPLMEAETRKFLSRLVADPSNYLANIRQSVGSP